MVAAVTCPFVTVMSALAFLPLLVILVKSTALYVNEPEFGVNPIPALIIFKLPVAIPALPI